MTAQIPQLDRTDFAIIDLLQKDGRLSNKEIAAQIGLAPSSCWERVKRLLDEKVILGFHAEVEPKILEVNLQAMIAIRLTRHSKSVVESFREYVMSVPEVMAVFHVAGPQDFLIHVGTRDADHLRELTISSFTTRPEVAHMETSLVFEHQRPRNNRELRGSNSL